MRVKYVDISIVNRFNIYGDIRSKKVNGNRKQECLIELKWKTCAQCYTSITDFEHLSQYKDLFQWSEIKKILAFLIYIYVYMDMDSIYIYGNLLKEIR